MFNLFRRSMRRRGLLWLLTLIIALPMLLMGMSALSANTEIPCKRGTLQSFPVEDNVHIYKGALVCENTSGYAVPAADTAGYKVLGIAYEEGDNTITGHSQGGITVRVDTSGRFLLTAAGLAQTSVGKMVYVTNDGAVALTATNYIPVGMVAEYVSATSAWVDLKPSIAFLTDPNSGFLNLVTKTDDYTVLAADSGKWFAIATDAKKFTLPATVSGLVYSFVNTGADGAAAITISPNASDKIMGGGLAGVDDKDLINTKATAKKYNFVTLIGDGVDGWIITRHEGIWAKEA